MRARGRRRRPARATLPAPVAEARALAPAGPGRGAPSDSSSVFDGVDQESEPTSRRSAGRFSAPVRRAELAPGAGNPESAGRARRRRLRARFVTASARLLGEEHLVERAPRCCWRCRVLLLPVMMATPRMTVRTIDVQSASPIGTRSRHGNEALMFWMRRWFLCASWAVGRALDDGPGSGYAASTPSGCSAMIRSTWSKSHLVRWIPGGLLPEREDDVAARREGCNAVEDLDFGGRVAHPSEPTASGAVAGAPLAETHPSRGSLSGEDGRVMQRPS